MRKEQKETQEEALSVEPIDYVALGRRIRGARKAMGLSQEKLAEMVDLSTPHVSHIENGSTKVSLPSLVLIANALQTTMDRLLHDNLTVLLEAYDAEFKELLGDCSDWERELLYTVVVNVKHVMKRKVNIPRHAVGK